MRVQAKLDPVFEGNNAMAKEPHVMNQPVIIQQSQSQGKYLAIAALIAVLGIVGYYVLKAPDTRNAGEQTSSSISELPMEDRTPGQNLDDAADEAVEDVKKATGQQ
jgi:hypothetical protein